MVEKKKNLEANRSTSTTVEDKQLQLNSVALNDLPITTKKMNLDTWVVAVSLDTHERKAGLVNAYKSAPALEATPPPTTLTTMNTEEDQLHKDKSDPTGKKDHLNVYSTHLLSNLNHWKEKQ